MNIPLGEYPLFRCVACIIFPELLSCCISRRQWRVVCCLFIGSICSVLLYMNILDLFVFEKILSTGTVINISINSDKESDNNIPDLGLMSSPTFGYCVYRLYGRRFWRCIQISDVP